VTDCAKISNSEYSRFFLCSFFDIISDIIDILDLSVDRPYSWASFVQTTFGSRLSEVFSFSR